MKKIVVSAVTAALVSAAASTTFAAANPFSDVPAGHWAYDYVNQLTQDGVIDGYEGTNEFRGDKQITRYEVAKIVATAMAKENISKADKAMVDKLASEFSDELQNLGVRVAALENKTDNVRWAGAIRMHWDKQRNHNGANEGNVQQIQMRFYPEMDINKHWTAKARIQGNLDWNTNSSADAKLYYAFAEGHYGDTVIKAGKLQTYDNADHGMVTDLWYSGAEATFGKDWQFRIGGGRWSQSLNTDVDVAANYGVAEIYYAGGKKLDGGLIYHHFSGMGNQVNGAPNGGERVFADGADSMGIIAGGIGYRFDKKWQVQGDYGHANANFVHEGDSSAYNFQLTYGQMDMKKPGSFSIWTGYRKSNNYAINMGATYEAVAEGPLRGWVIGGGCTLAENIFAKVEMHRGDDYNTGKQKSDIYTRVQINF